MFRIFVFVCCILTIQATCPNVSVPWQTSCYFFKPNASGFPTAESDCNLLGGHLASIHDGFTNALITNNAQNLFHESTVTDFWIGFTNLITMENWAWMDSSNSSFIEWSHGEPGNATINNCAGVSLTDGKWSADDCFKLKPYVCVVKESIFEPTTILPTTTTTTTTKKYPTCQYPFMYFEPTNSCYGNANWTGPLAWSQAEEICLAFGAHLISIHSFEENQFLGSLDYIIHDNIWTGAFSIDGGQNWKWTDGTPWDYPAWYPGYPKLQKSACGRSWGNGVIDWDCNDVKHFLCKKSL